MVYITWDKARVDLEWSEDLNRIGICLVQVRTLVQNFISLNFFFSIFKNKFTDKVKFHFVKFTDKELARNISNVKFHFVKRSAKFHVLL